LATKRKKKFPWHLIGYSVPHAGHQLPLRIYHDAFQQSFTETRLGTIVCNS
jgi:hypothetical protein